MQRCQLMDSVKSLAKLVSIVVSHHSSKIIPFYVLQFTELYRAQYIEIALCEGVSKIRHDADRYLAI